MNVKDRFFALKLTWIDFKIKMRNFPSAPKRRGACLSLMYFFESGSPFAITIPPMFDIEIIYSFGHSVNILVTFSQKPLVTMHNLKSLILSNVYIAKGRYG